MQDQATTQRKSPVEGTHAKVKHIDVSPEFKLALQAHYEYSRVHHCITDEEEAELPPGFTTHPPERAIYRTISMCHGNEHVQLIHYPQPVLDNLSTAQFLTRVKESTEINNAAYLPFKEYVKQHYIWMCEFFPYAARVAYDIHELGVLSAKSIELEKCIAERHSNIVKSIKG